MSSSSRRSGAGCNRRCASRKASWSSARRGTGKASSSQCSTTARPNCVPWSGAREASAKSEGRMVGCFRNGCPGAGSAGTHASSAASAAPQAPRRRLDHRQRPRKRLSPRCGGRLAGGASAPRAPGAAGTASPRASAASAALSPGSGPRSRGPWCSAPSTVPLHGAAPPAQSCSAGNAPPVRPLLSGRSAACALSWPLWVSGGSVAIS
mmetsp:Transcript_129516/g.360832  ORF Transcript_129516/g.360832 Transcript_129516/m.360832 type:complete len:208 (-) Transcript_129516:1194-1817(-)